MDVATWYYYRRLTQPFGSERLVFSASASTLEILLRRVVHTVGRRLPLLPLGFPPLIDDASTDGSLSFQVANVRAS